MNIDDKNIYESIIKFADDRTVIDMLNANVKFKDDENFFERLVRARYPFLSRYKKTTWKKLYLKMVHYMAKLEEEFGIPYIPEDIFNPETFYKTNKTSINIYNAALSHASLAGSEDIVQLMLDKGANQINPAMNYAAYGGHTNIVRMMLDKGARDFNGSFENAARNGHMDIVQLMIDKGATDFNTALGAAIAGKHTAIIRLLKDKGAIEVDHGPGKIKKMTGRDILEHLKYENEKIIS